MDAWASTSITDERQAQRLWLAASAPLWFLPLLLLVAARRWVLWLLRPDAEPSPSR